MANTLNLGNGNWATKEDSLLAYNSENGNFKPLPFDFTRASSATVVNKAGLIETVGSGEPRIDFSNDAKGALLLEPTRSNLITYSEAFDNAYWTKLNATITSSNVNAPNGTQSAYTLNATSSYGRIGKYVTYIATDYTLSVFVKKATTSQSFAAAFSQFGGSDEFSVDINTGVTLSQGSNILSVSCVSYGNFWRVIATSTRTVGSAEFRIFAGYPTNISATIYGAQLEQGSYATSYISTQGSSVTRVADSSESVGLQNVVNSSEGVFYFNTKALSSTKDYRISLSDGSANNRVSFSYSPNVNTAYCLVQLGGAQVLYNLSVPLTNQTEYKKFAIKWKSGDLAFWVDGAELISSNGVFTAGTIDRLRFNDASGGIGFKAAVKDVRVYSTILTDSELQALTT